MSTSTFQGTPRVPRKTLLQQFIEGNYFYVVSAGLMMLGCYLLMKQPDPALGVFERTLRSLLILQAYEVLVIVTAVAIVRRFRRLGDGFTLLVIELALLLDPTFFSNSFLTMIPVMGTLGASLGVNGACLVLAAVKLFVLQRMLGLRFSPFTQVALLLACFVVYFGTLPLNLGALPLSREACLYLLGWMVVAVCLVVPALPTMVRMRSESGDFMTPSQGAWLPRWLMILPVGVVIAHYIESANVYGIRFYWSYGAPLLIGAALLIINNQRETQPGTESRQRLLVTDMLSGLALLLSLKLVAVEGKAAMVSREPAAPAFIADNIPLKAVAVALVLLYVYAWRRLRDPAALVRVAVLAIGGLVYLVVRYVIEPLIRAAEKLLAGLGERLLSLFSSPMVVLWVLFGICLVAAWKYRKFATWMLAGLFGIVLGFKSVLGGVLLWGPEILEAVLVWWLVLLHRFGDTRKEKPIAAATIALVALGRGFVTDAPWTWGVSLLQAVGFLAAGAWLRQRCYSNVGLLQAVVTGLAFVPSVTQLVNPAAMALVIGLALFAVGVVVTFRKESMVRRWTLQPTGMPPDGVGARPGPGKSPESPRPVPGDRERTESQRGHRAAPPAAGPSGQKPSQDTNASDRRQAATLDAVAMHLQTIFLHEPENGIHVHPHIPPRNVGTFAGEIGFQEGEVIIVSIAPMQEGFENGALLLTNRAAYLVEDRKPVEDASGKVIDLTHDEYRSLNVMEYGRIAGIGRVYATLTIRGHAGQRFIYCGLSAPQALIVKSGLEALITEIAFERLKGKMYGRESKS